MEATNNWDNIETNKIFFLQRKQTKIQRKERTDKLQQINNTETSHQHTKHISLVTGDVFVPHKASQLLLLCPHKL